MEKNKILFFVMFFIVAVFLQSASAHFVCGVLEDSADNMSSDWFRVNIYYPENPSAFASCSVSPEEKKYCCDVEEIPSLEGWEIGKIVSTEVFDEGLGYFSGPVSVETTGEGYDVLENMELKKIMKVNLPTSNLVVSNKPLIDLEIETNEPFNKILMDSGEGEAVLCSDCNSYVGVFEGDYGMNYFSLIADDGERRFVENKSVALVKDYSFERNFDCEGCKNNKVRPERDVKISLNLDLSNEVEGLVLKEYVPVDWEIVNAGGGSVEPYSESHNLIAWVVDGQGKDFTYVVKSPDVGFISSKYIFESELEDLPISGDKVTVYKYFSFIYKNEDFITSNFVRDVKRVLALDKPIVLNDYGFVDTLAVFGNNFEKNVNLELNRFDEIDLDKELVGGYEVKSNLKEEDVDHFFVRLKVNESLGEGSYAYIFDGKEWNIFVPSYEKREGESIIYEGEVENLEKIALVKDKEESFFEKIF